MIRMLPCPKCGSKARTPNCYDTSRKHGYVTHCTNPLCRFWGEWAKTNTGAVRKWNTKAKAMKRDGFQKNTEANNEQERM